MLQCAADSPAYLVAGLVVDPFFSRSLCVQENMDSNTQPCVKAFAVQVLGCLPLV